MMQLPVDSRAQLADHAHQVKGCPILADACLTHMVWMRRYKIGIRHLKSRQHIVAVFFLCHSHCAILEILFHIASQKLNQLSAVAQFKNLAAR